MLDAADALRMASCLPGYVHTGSEPKGPHCRNRGHDCRKLEFSDIKDNGNSVDILGRRKRQAVGPEGEVPEESKLLLRCWYCCSPNCPLGKRHSHHDNHKNCEVSVVGGFCCDY